MTKEELIKHLEHLAEYVKYSEDAPALREAIALLSQSYSTERAQERTETHACDLIDRQGAIDIGRRATVDTNPEHFESHQKFVEFMDDAEISSFGRWQWSNGFNTALTAVGIDLKRLPSAQPMDVQEAYYLGKIDGIKECTERLKRVTEEIDNERNKDRSDQQTGGD